MAAQPSRRTFKLDVGGMTCASCVGTVASVLDGVDGVLKAE
jgi:copper chaperone CopZ